MENKMFITIDDLKLNENLLKGLKADLGLMTIKDLVNYPKYLEAKNSQISSSNLTNLTEKEKKFFKANSIKTYADLASFIPFVMAEKIVAENNIANKYQSLIPQAIGSIVSTASYSSFVTKYRVKCDKFHLRYHPDMIRSIFVKYLEIFRQVIYHDKNSRGVLDEDALLFDQNPVLHFGYIAKSTQTWKSFGSKLGDPKKTIGLAPGQPLNYAIVEWEANRIANRNENSNFQDTFSNRLVHTRSLDEVIEATAKEHQEGNTKTISLTAGNSNSSSGGFGDNYGAGSAAGGDLSSTGIPIQIGTSNTQGIGLGLGGSSVISGARNMGYIESETDSVRDTMAELHQNIMDISDQKASNSRSFRASTVVTDLQREGLNLHTTTIVNYNKNHTLNLIFYEMLQTYKAEIEIKDKIPVLYLPYRSFEFDNAFIFSHVGFFRNRIPDFRIHNIFEELLENNAQSQSQRNTNLLIRGIEVISPLNFTVAIAVFGFNGDDYYHYTNINNGSGYKPTVITNQLPKNIVDINVIRINNDSSSTPTKIRLNYTIGEGQTTSKIILLRNGEHRFVDLFYDILNNSNDIDKKYTELVNYFNYNSYYFTKLLLLSFEKEVLRDMIEAIFLHEYQVVLDDDVLGGINYDKKLFLSEFVDSNPLAIADGYIILKLKNVKLAPSSFNRLDRIIYKNNRNYNKNDSKTIESKDNIFNAFLKNIGLGSKNNNNTNNLPSLEKPNKSSIQNSEDDLKKSSNSGVKNSQEQNESAGNTRQENHTDTYTTISDVINKFESFFSSLKILDDNNKREKVIDLPTNGLFLEGILGQLPCAEEYDTTRNTSWHEDGIPYLGTQINNLNAQSFYQQPTNITPTQPESNISQSIPTALPSSQLSDGVMNALNNGNLFRDMSKSNQLISSLNGLIHLSGKLADNSTTLTDNARHDAMEAASKIANTVAGIAGDIVKSNPYRPQSQAEKGSAINELNKNRFLYTDDQYKEKLDSILGIDQNPSGEKATVQRGTSNRAVDLRILVSLRNPYGKILFDTDIPGIDLRYIIESDQEPRTEKLLSSGFTFGAVEKNLKLTKGTFGLLFEDSGKFPFVGKTGITLSSESKTLIVEAKMASETLALTFSRTESISATITNALTNSIGSKLSSTTKASLAGQIEETVGAEISSQLTTQETIARSAGRTDAVTINFGIKIPTGELVLTIF